MRETGRVCETWRVEAMRAGRSAPQSPVSMAGKLPFMIFITSSLRFDACRRGGGESNIALFRHQLLEILRYCEWRERETERAVGGKGAPERRGGGGEGGT